ncbi:MAG: D-glycero-beta-D-manno-heptose 1-phosphate adenylyltransferase [Candidatus Omnitrophota bacterium]
MRTCGRSRFIENKIISPARLKIILKQLQSAGKKIVFTNGCFDLIHAGHVRYLSAAKNMGDVLILGLNSDSSVRKIKGPKRPLVTQKDRLAVMASLECIDFVVIFNETTPLKIIQILKPDILVKGADWKSSDIVGADFVKKHGGKVATIKLTRGRSTSNLIKKIVKIYG